MCVLYHDFMRLNYAYMRICGLILVCVTLTCQLQDCSRTTSKVAGTLNSSTGIGSLENAWKVTWALTERKSGTCVCTGKMPTGTDGEDSISNSFLTFASCIATISNAGKSCSRRVCVRKREMGGGTSSSCCTLAHLCERKWEML